MAKEPERKAYGEFGHVLLSDEELAKLQQKYPAWYQQYIEKVDGYVDSTGKKYKKYYSTVQNWIKRDIEDGKLKVSAEPTYDLDEIEQEAFFGYKKPKAYGTYGNVLLYDEQFETLRKKYPKEYKDTIAELDRYIQSTGRRYDDIAATLEDWIERKRSRMKPKTQTGNISRAPTYDLEKIKRDAHNNTEIKY